MMDPRPEQAADWFRNLTGVDYPQPGRWWACVR